MALSSDVIVIDNAQQNNENNEPILHANHFQDTGVEEVPNVSPIKEANGDGSFLSNVIETPNGTKHWVPIVTENLIPVVGAVFQNFEDVKLMYNAYAKKSGFGIRVSTLKRNKENITNRYLKCNRAGKPRNKVEDSLKQDASHEGKRSSNFTVTDCKACIGVGEVSGTESYVVKKFISNHNHSLFNESNIELSRPRRQLTFDDQEFIHKVSTSNIGPTKAHRLMSLLKGGYVNVRGTVVDYKNFRRDMNRFIGDKDAQMLVDKLNNRKKCVPGYSFEYKVVNNELNSLFWSDETSKCSYDIFGDVLAFDATYETNKYDMIFVPFTGVDNHNKCVTFGAGLLKSESIESYKWLLEAFLKAHGKQPRLVLIDQDAAMKQAIPTVFPESTHRLCMWHIMKKLPSKVSGDLLENTALKKRLHKLVWNVFLTPAKFEEGWSELISEYDLQDNRWLSDMYDIRERWIPGFFREIPMCCLMKTTSISESENSFFRIYSSPGNSLVQFMICFETAMEKQRYDQKVLDNATTTTTPSWKTHLPIERFASDVYTRTMFNLVQKEIVKGLYTCTQKSVVTEGNSEVCTIKHKNKHGIFVAEFKVVLNQEDSTVVCSCNHFTRHGYLCRHIFFVMKDFNFSKIPDLYVLKRWRRDVIPSELRTKRNKHGPNNYENETFANEAAEIVDSCVARLRCDTEKFAVFIQKLNELKDEVERRIPTDPTPKNKEEAMKALLGVEPPEKVLIKVPQGIRNKGCGTKKRLVGPGQKAKEASKKKKRKCWTCGKYVRRHDSRNCPTKTNSKNLEESESEKELESEPDPDSDTENLNSSGDESMGGV